jgi:hypothetical protein
MSQRVETSARELVSTRSSQPENGHLRKKFSIRYPSHGGDHKIFDWNLHIFVTRE